jgi:hypothetical protein
MNFKDLKTKMVLEKFLRECKKYSIKSDDIDKIGSILLDRNYVLNEVGFRDFVPPIIGNVGTGIKNWVGGKIQSGLEKAAGWGYKRGLNRIIAQTQDVLKKLTQSSTDVEKLIQTYKLDDDKTAKEILGSLKNLQEPYKLLQNKINTLSTSKALGLRGGAVEPEAEAEGLNMPLINNIVSQIQTEFDAKFPAATATDQTKQNKVLLLKAVEKYFKALDPAEYQKKLNEIKKGIAKSVGNDAKMFAVISGISKATGRSPIPKAAGQNMPKIDKATLDNWAEDLNKRLKDTAGNYVVNQKIANNFIKIYKNFMNVSDSTEIYNIHSKLAGEIKKEIEDKLTTGTFNKISAEQFLQKQIGILTTFYNQLMKNNQTTSA